MRKTLSLILRILNLHYTPSVNPRSPKFILSCLFLIAAVAGGLSLVLPRTTPAAPTTPPSAPRIAALSPALAVTLKDLGVANLIVGRHSYDLVLDKSIPVCFDLQNADYEKLLSVHPTHILLQLQSQKRPARLDELATANNWRILDFPILALDDIKSTTTRLADLFNPGADRPLLREMDRAWSTRANAFTGKVLLLGAVDPPSALGPGSWHHQLLERLGGTPAVTQGSPYITFDAEDILHMKPDAILLILPRDPTTPAATPTIDELRRQLGRVGTLDIPAIRNSRLALIDNPLAHTPSTAMIGLADEMAAILERWNSR